MLNALLPAGHIARILLDPGATHTIMSNNLQDKLKIQDKGSTYLKLETIIGSSTDCHSQKFSLTIPTKKGDIEIKGYKLNKRLTSVHDVEKIDLNRLWPNLNSRIKREAEANRFSGQVDLII